MQPSGEILPPQNYWFPKGVKFFKSPGIRVVSGGLFTIVFVGWLIQNFLTMRGYVNIIASRIDLYFAAVVLIGCAWLFCLNCQRRRFGWGIICTLAIMAVAPAVDRVTLPKVIGAHASTAQPPIAPSAGQGNIPTVEKQKDAPEAVPQIKVDNSTHQSFVEASGRAKIGSITVSNSSITGMAKSGSNLHALDLNGTTAGRVIVNDAHICNVNSWDEILVCVESESGHPRAIKRTVRDMKLSFDYYLKSHPQIGPCRAIVDQDATMILKNVAQEHDTVVFLREHRPPCAAK
jgi:hypothetical protein